MLYGQVANLELWSNLFPTRVQEIVSDLLNGKFANYSCGKHLLDEQNYLSISEYATELSSSKSYEFHQKYVDLQIVLEGEELIFLSPVSVGVSDSSVQTVDDDCWFVKQNLDTSMIHLRKGDFLFIFPPELHKPGCCTDSPSSMVKKMVIKLDKELFLL